MVMLLFINGHGKDMESEQVQSKRLLIAATLALAFLLSVGTWFLIRYGQNLPGTQDTGGTMEPEQEQDAELTLKTFHIALAGPGHETVQLELAIGHQNDPALKKELSKRDTQIREIVHFTVQKKTRDFLLAPMGREALSQELRNAINQVMHRKISDLHVTQHRVSSRK
jgi:flagellar basal body-associated protein FliL